MKYIIQRKLYRIAVGLEILVGLCILIAIPTATVGLFLNNPLSYIFETPELLQDYLTTTMTIIIGIEFVKMIFNYTIDTIVEVLLLAVARQMVLSHTSPIDNLITILCVALLFVIRKFLFIRQLDHAQESSADYLLPFFKRKKVETASSQAHNETKSESTHRKDKEITDVTS